MKVLVNTCTVGAPFLRAIEPRWHHKGCGHRLPDIRWAGRCPGGYAVRYGLRRSGGGREATAADFSVGQHAKIAGDKPDDAQVLKFSLAAMSEAFVIGAKGGLNPEVMVR